MKIIISFVMVMIFLFSLFPFTAFAGVEQVVNADGTTSPKIEEVTGIPGAAPSNADAVHPRQRPQQFPPYQPTPLEIKPKEKECPCNDPKKYAVLVIGENDAALGFMNDGANMESFLKAQGYETTTLVPTKSSSGGMTGAITGMQIAMRNIGGVRPSQLPSAPGNTFNPSNSKPTTPQSLHDALQEIANKVRCCDSVFVYVSSHGLKTSDGSVCYAFDMPYEALDFSESFNRGIAVEPRPGPEPKKVMVGNPEGDCLDAKVLAGWLNQITCCNTEFLLDACYAGALNDHLTNPGVSGIASSDANTPSGTYDTKGYGEGAATRAFLDCQGDKNILECINQKLSSIQGMPNRAVQREKKDCECCPVKEPACPSDPKCAGKCYPHEACEVVTYKEGTRCYACIPKCPPYEIYNNPKLCKDTYGICKEGKNKCFTFVDPNTVPVDDFISTTPDPVSGPGGDPVSTGGDPLPPRIGSDPVPLNCPEECSKRGYSSSPVSHDSYILNYISRYTCVSGVRVTLPGTLTITGPAGDRCTCYASSPPIIDIDSTPPVCQSECGPVNCGSSTSCSCGEGCTLTVSCNWGGWKQTGSGSFQAVIGID